MNIIVKHLDSKDIRVVSENDDFDKFHFSKDIFFSFEKKKLISNAAAVYESFEAKEQNSSSGIGESIAIPHIRHENIKAVHATVFIFRSGVQYNSFDGKDVKLVFLTLLPERETFLSLAINSTILKFFKANPIDKYLSIADDEELITQLYADIASFHD